MADTQTPTQAITQQAIEATNKALKAMAVIRAEAGTEPRSESISMGHRLDRPTLK